MKILVTGGAGFIGSHIVDFLIEKGHEVTIMDNLSTGFINNVNNQATFINADITNYESCVDIMKGIDIVCHQAALGSVPRSVATPLISHHNNVTGFLNILEAARVSGIKRVVYASSSAVYGDSVELPKVETRIGKPISPYGATKFIDEVYAGVYNRVYGMECIGLRYFNVFGPRQNPNGPYAAVIPIFINKLLNNEQPMIYGDGSNSRDFTYISNIVSANYEALTTTNVDTFGNAYNIGGNDNTTLDQLFYYIKKITNSHLKPIYESPRKADIPHSLADINFAYKDLNYKPQINLYDGLIKTCEYYKNTKNKSH